jgi:hypothetical protein
LPLVPQSQHGIGLHAEILRVIDGPQEIDAITNLNLSVLINPRR